MLALNRDLPKEREEETEQRKQALRLRNLYRSFVDNTFELIFRSSLQDEIQFSNKLFVETFGFGKFRKAKGSKVHELFNDLDDYNKLKVRAIREQRVQGVAVNFKSLEGKKIVALVNIQIQTNELGEPMINWTALDISERVAFEQNLELKNQQLAKINHQMEKFLYSTSHDLRAPLTTIMGLVNLIRMDSKDNSLVEYADKIELSTHKLDKIIRDIISFSKTTYKNIHSEKIDFESLIWKIVNNHCGDDNFGKIRVQVSVVGSSLFYSDTDRIEIILDNLIRNAVQFVDINKAHSFINITTLVSADTVVVEIHDNGIGIARQYFESIFNMFYKATVHSKGAGLGLYIAKEGIEQLGGSISVNSEVGFGSLFKLSIPNSPKGKLINRKQQLNQAAI
ncbi:hypothetical protein SanaruYs_25850 [Chryseotalea sanaruensis]|uniref:histidine kinase n=1 Tax=Chryseotalea sanaruensis TaxID=2482724 RepID=A0A401UBR2_9BACT|nr:PAS domain-containing sensor histidine kinase [Chryseotalea sanaruensis]GCC52348.1 hypothetical protein SanaruYs_25850 [Chryseotalea sanaruensis]